MQHTVIIRKISTQDIAGIDEAARHAKVSREQYLRELIHHDATTLLRTDEVANFHELTRHCLTVIERNIELMERVSKQLREMK